MAHIGQMDSVVAQADLKGSGALASDTMTYVNFCHEFIYDLTYDSCIEALVKKQQAGKYHFPTAWHH